MVYVSPCSLIVHCKINSLPALPLLGSFMEPAKCICYWRLSDSFWLISSLIAENHMECNKYIHFHLSQSCKHKLYNEWVLCWKLFAEIIFRSSLMTGGVKRGVTNPWLLEESEETRGLGFDDLRQQQRRIIEGTRVFLLYISIARTLRGTLIESQYSNLCWSFIIWRCQT